MTPLLPVDVQNRADAEVGAAFRRLSVALPPDAAWGLEFEPAERRAGHPWSAWTTEPDWMDWGGTTPIDALNALADALESRTE